MPLYVNPALHPPNVPLALRTGVMSLSAATPRAHAARYLSELEALYEAYFGDSTHFGDPFALHELDLALVADLDSLIQQDTLGGISETFRTPLWRIMPAVHSGKGCAK